MDDWLPHSLARPPSPGELVALAEGRAQAKAEAAPSATVTGMTRAETENVADAFIFMIY